MYQSVKHIGCFSIWRGAFFSLLIPLYLATFFITLVEAQQTSTGQSSSTLNMLLQNLTPDQQQAIQNLTPDQRKALKDQVLQSGEMPTPDKLQSMVDQIQQQSPSQNSNQQSTSAATPLTEAEAQKLRDLRATAEKTDKEYSRKVQKLITDQTGTTVQFTRYGLDLFAASRKKITSYEQALNDGATLQALQKAASNGAVGPLDMVTSLVNASPPAQYVLSPGDQVSIYYWGDLIEVTTLKGTIDDRGEIVLPKSGRFVARGMSLEQFEKAVRDQLKRAYGKDVKVTATLDSLKSIQILIIGETFRPGSYAVSAVTTLVNALYASGGPNENGSLRDIKLIQNNKATTLDFYAYLNGDAHADYPLQAGDTIVIGRVGKIVSITGEVNRSGLYELKSSESLRDLVRIVNGIKPTGLNNKVHIQSIVPHKERAVFDVDLSKDSLMADYPLYDGDTVTVDVIIPDVMNKVMLQGDVKVPGDYELKPGMRVVDLFNGVNQPWGEAHLDRADIVRVDKDRRTTTIIPINLGKALKYDPQNNIPLAELDTVIVYSKWDVKYHTEMTVSIRGAVQKPGSYPRSEGMRIKDLLLRAGGPLPGSSNELTISKGNYLGDAKLTTVRLDLLEQGDESQNVVLEDEDIVMVRESSDFFEKPMWVEIKGEVAFPGSYPIKNKIYRLSDLIKAAGGLTKAADPRGTVFLRKKDHLPSPEQQNDVQNVNTVINKLNDIDYKRLTARNLFLLQQEAMEAKDMKASVIGASGTTVVNSSATTKDAALMTMAPSLTGATNNITQGAVAAFTVGGAMTSPARQLSDDLLAQSNRVIVNIDRAMSGDSGNPDDVVLRNGDFIRIPQHNETVSLVGAVMNSVTVHLKEPAKLKNVIQLAGGYAKDADEDGVLVLRIDGSMLPAATAKYAEEGDIIYVPTKVMSTEIMTTTDKIISVVKYALATAAGVAVLLAILP